jgi:guanylate kinase
MLLIRLSGHSGAGKSRLLAALPRYGLACPRAVLYTSRLAREDERHGVDYYFLSRAAIAALPSSDFHCGPVRENLQGVDLSQLETDLRSSDAVFIDIHADMWPALIARLEERRACPLPSVSVFLTAVHLHAIVALPEQARGGFIRAEVERILRWRNKDAPDKIRIRAQAASHEVLTAISPEGAAQYARVFDSSLEGPNGEDEWTKGAEPVGDARRVLDEFIAFHRSVVERKPLSPGWPVHPSRAVCD